MGAISDRFHFNVKEMSFTQLPHELLQLISLYLSDEEMQQWSLVSHTMYLLLHKLWLSSLFWKERYTITFAGGHCCAANLLPEAIAFYGWQKLYARVQFSPNTSVQREYYVGVTGNLYIHHNETYRNFLALPLSEMIWSEKLSEGIIIIYLNYDNVIECLLCRLQGDMLETNNWSPFTKKHITQHYIDSHCLVFVFDDGDVWINQKYHNLRKLARYFDNAEKPNTVEELGFEATKSPSGGFSVSKDRMIHVDTFAVCIYEKHSYDILVSCPRTSQGHLDNVSRTISSYSS